MDKSKVYAHVCVTYQTTSSENGAVGNAGQLTTQIKLEIHDRKLDVIRILGCSKRWSQCTDKFLECSISGVYRSMLGFVEYVEGRPACLYATAHHYYQKKTTQADKHCVAKLAKRPRQKVVQHTTTAETPHEVSQGQTPAVTGHAPISEELRSPPSHAVQVNACLQLRVCRNKVT